VGKQKALECNMERGGGIVKRGKALPPIADEAARKGDQP